MTTIKQMKTLPAAVLLATEDFDFGLVDGASAMSRAQSEANQCGMTVYLRDPTTDQVLARVRPCR